MFTEAETTARLPVWHAFSELFRDTQTSEAEYQDIADLLRNSGFASDQLLSLLADETAPACFGNLLQIAGDWEGWSEGSVRENMHISMRRRAAFPPGHWLLNRLSRSHARQEWEKIAQLPECR